MRDMIRTTMGKLVQAFRGEVSTLRSQLEKAKRRREELLTAPLAKEDVIELLHAHVDDQAREYRPLLQKAIEALHRERTVDPRRVGHFVNGGVLSPSEGYQPGLENFRRGLQTGLFFVFGDQLKTALSAAIEGMDWPPDAGAPRAEREAELKRVNAEIVRLQAELDELDRERREIINTFE